MVNVVVLKRTDWFVEMGSQQRERLTSESVEGATLPLEGVDHIHRSYSLPLCMLGVGDSIPDHVLEEDLEDSSGFLVNQARDPLHSPAPCQTPDGGLCDALDVVPQHFPVALGATLPESLASFASSGHGTCS